MDELMAEMFTATGARMQRQRKRIGSGGRKDLRERVAVTGLENLDERYDSGCPVGALEDVPAGRFLFWEEAMKLFGLCAVVVISVGGLLNGVSWAFDIPKVHAIILPKREMPRDFGRAYCCVGDQNNDGYDDLLICDDPQFERVAAINTVNLYYGGVAMDDSVDFMFRADPIEDPDEYHGEGIGVLRLLNLNGFLGRNWLGMGFPAVRNEFWDEHGEPYQQNYYLFEGGDNLDSIPEFAWRRPAACAFRPPAGENNKPADLNGDGYTDLVVVEIVGDSTCQLTVFYGSVIGDTIADWHAALPNSNISLSWGIDVSAGWDVNGDGYDDMLVRRRFFIGDDLTGSVAVYLGGFPMDTIPALEVIEPRDGFIVGYNNSFGFSMLGDVNGDGFDDWGFYGYYEYAQNRFRDGFGVYYGGEHLDFGPDVILEGHRRLWAENGNIASGDFNGDGYCDIVTATTAGNPFNSEFFIYFGRESLLDTADIYFLGEQILGRDHYELGYNLGGVGDYNGDGVDDFVAAQIALEDVSGAKVVVFLGSNDWSIIPTDKPPEMPNVLMMRTFPNPFNNGFIFDYTIPFEGEWRLDLFSIDGRLVQTLFAERLPVGSQHFAWISSGLPSGTYLANLSSISDSRFQILTKVVKL